MTITRLLGAFAFLVACNRGVSEHADRADPNIRTFDADDAEMNAAFGRARSTVPVLLDRLAHPSPTQTLISAKVRLEESGVVEHIWLDSLSFDGRNLHGTLNDAPRDLRRSHLGDRIEVRPDEISDWMVVDGDRLCGGWTIRVARDKATPEERRAWDEDSTLVHVPRDTATCSSGAPRHG